MMVTYKEKMKNPDYYNLQYIPQSKWKWVISVVYNMSVTDKERGVDFEGTLERFNELVTTKDYKSEKTLGFLVGEVQPCGKRFHIHSIWSEFDYDIGVLNVNFKLIKGINSFKIEKFYPKCITDKDFLWYILKDPVGVYYNNNLKEEIVFGRCKVKQLEKRLRRKEGYHIPTRFNHLKTFISEEGRNVDMENSLKKLLERR